MTQTVEVISPEALWQETAQPMQAATVGALPVCDGTRVVGILTEHDRTAQAAMEGRPGLTLDAGAAAPPLGGVESRPASRRPQLPAR